MNTKQKMDIEAERGPSAPYNRRRGVAIVTDDLGGGWGQNQNTNAPAYVLLVERGYPNGLTPVRSVGLKSRRQAGAEEAPKTFSVQDPDWSIIERVKTFAKDHNVTIKSVAELFFLEGLEKHGG